MASVRGKIERLCGSILSGWAYQEPDDTPVELTLKINGRHIGNYRADLYRGDLKAKSIGSGWHGFEIHLNRSALMSGPNVIEVLTAAGEQIGNAFEHIHVTGADAGTTDGRIDRVANHIIYGWVWDRAEPEKRQNFELLCNDLSAGIYRADVHRGDLEAKAMGDGCHAYEVPLPMALCRPGDNQFELRSVPGGQVIGRSLGYYHVPQHPEITPPPVDVSDVSPITAPSNTGQDAERSKGIIIKLSGNGTVSALPRPGLAPSAANTDANARMTDAREGQVINLIPNAGFLHWKHGLRNRVRERYQTVCDGWLADYRSGTSPDIEVALTEVTNVGNKAPLFGMRMHIASYPSDTYVRLVCVLGDLSAAGDYFLDCGLRTPLDATLGGVTVRELFIARLRQTDGKYGIEKLASVRKRIATVNTLRLRNIPVTITRQMLDDQAPGDEIALAFDLDGIGDLVIFDPSLHLQKHQDVPLEASQGEFEDGHIREQLKQMKLSPIWQAGQAISQFDAVPRPIVGIREPSPIPFIQIVIPVFNAALDVEECVRSIIDNTMSPFEVILSDDGSEPYTLERLRAMAAADPRIRLHLNPENLGYTRNINQALQLTTADYVALLNSDVVVPVNWLHGLYAAINASSDTAAAGPLSNAASWQSVPLTKSSSGWAVNTLYSGITVNDMAALVERLAEGSFPVFPLLNGFCTLFRRRVIEEAGYFADDAFPMGYGEENDLCLRITRLGYKLRVADNCYVYHKKSRSFGSERRRELTKRANVLLRQRHPEVNFDKLQEDMRDCATINLLRTRLKDAMQIEMATYGPEEAGHLAAAQ